MRTFAAGALQRGPRRSQPGNVSRPFPRGELAAALGTIALIAELLLVPAAAPVSLVLLAAGRLSRWRPDWLLLPVLAGAGWLAAAGPLQALTSVLASPGLLLSGLTRAIADPSPLLHDPGGAAAAALAFLLRELPAGLVVGAVQAGLLTWVGLRRDGGRWRPGLVAAARRWRSRAVLTAGQNVTGEGFAIGLDRRTGALTRLSWPAAERGVLLTGIDPGELSAVALAVGCSALRRRKTVLACDFGDHGSRDAASLTGATAQLAGALRIPVSWVTRPDDLPMAVGRAIRARGVLVASGPGALLTARVISVLESLREQGLRGDSLLCLSRCEAVDPALLTALFALGPATGTAVLASTTSAACAAGLAGHVGQTVACGPVSQELLAWLVARRPADAGALARQRPGDFTVIDADGVRPGNRAVPITALAGPAGASRGARLTQDLAAAAGTR